MKRPVAGTALLALLLLAGCEDPQAIRVYSVERRAPAPHAHSADDGHDHGAHGPEAHPPAAPAGELAWELPPGWEVSPEARPMRWATLVAPGGLEVAITRFPGDVGGKLANVNRWRGQVGLGPIGEPGLPEALRPVEGAALPVELVDLTGGQERLLAALLEGQGETWFLKLQGPLDQVAPLEPGFQALLRSLRLGPGGLGGGMPVAPPSLPAGPGADLPFGYDVPAGWEPAPAAPPRLLSLRAGTGELSVTRFPGDVGGALPNLNRWRGQVGLAPLDALPPDAFQPLLVGGLSGQLLELVGQDRAQLVALVPRAGETWFFKLSADPAGVSAERARFQSFLESVRWEEPR